jgi:hypothetical protein
MQSPISKRSIVLAGYKTSVSLEDRFWTALKDTAASRHMTLSNLVASIDSERKHGTSRRQYGCSCLITIGRAFDLLAGPPVGAVERVPNRSVPADYME